MNFTGQINKIENFCLKFDIMFKSCQHLWSLSSILEVIAGDKRSLPPILGQRHSSNCIARFFPDSVHILEMPVLYIPTNMHGMWLRRPWC